MKLFAILLCAASLAGIGLYLFGFYTRIGQLYFDEMAGIIPLLAGFAGLIGLLVSAGLFYWLSR